MPAFEQVFDHRRPCQGNALPQFSHAKGGDQCVELKTAGIIDIVSAHPLQPVPPPSSYPSTCNKEWFIKSRGSRMGVRAMSSGEHTGWRMSQVKR